MHQIQIHQTHFHVAHTVFELPIVVHFYVTKKKEGFICKLHKNKTILPFAATTKKQPHSRYTHKINYGKIKGTVCYFVTYFVSIVDIDRS